MASVPVMVRMDIAYDGSFTYGFQKQESLVSVQGTVERALRAVCGSYIPVVGASRTDRGVHALHNVVSFVLRNDALYELSLIHISEPTRLGMISYAVFCLKKKKNKKSKQNKHRTPRKKGGRKIQTEQIK